jgi:hypothetical protein
MKSLEAQQKRKEYQKAWREKNKGYFQKYQADVKAGNRIRKSRKLDDAAPSSSDPQNSQ